MSGGISPSSAPPGLGTLSSPVAARTPNAPPGSPPAVRRRIRGGGEAAPTSRAGMSVVAFAEHPDRLLCDPSNALWLYAVFEYKYGCSHEVCHAQLLRLLQKIEKITAYHYEAAVKQFQSLPLTIQHFQVLRATPIGMANTMLVPSTKLVHPAGPHVHNPFGSGVPNSPRRQGANRAGAASSPDKGRNVSEKNTPNVAGRRLSLPKGGSSATPGSGSGGSPAAGTSPAATPGHPTPQGDELDLLFDEDDVPGVNGEAPLRPPQPFRLPEDVAVKVLAAQWPPLVGLSELEEQLLLLRKAATDQSRQKNNFNTISSRGDTGMQRNQVLQLLQLEGGGQESNPASPPNGPSGHSPHTNPLVIGQGKGGQREGSMPHFAKDGGVATQGESSSVMSASISSRRRMGGGGGGGGVSMAQGTVLGAGKNAASVPAARPKIKVVLDIVASRKTLGTDPLSSPPYKLGQWVYQHYTGATKRTSSGVAAALMSSGVLDSDPRTSFPFPAPPSAGSPRRGIADSSVTSAGGSHSGFPATSYTTTPACCQIFVGISDSPVKMVGRDFLYPFKLPPGGGNSGTVQRLSLMLTPSQLLMHSVGAPLPTHLLPPVPYVRNQSAGAVGAAPSPSTAGVVPGTAGGTGGATNTLTRTRSSSSMSMWSHPSMENTGSPRHGHRVSSADNGTFLFNPSGELPICIRQPPTHLEMIDQKRFIICHPHIE